jgi:hypothetical protein
MTVAVPPLVVEREGHRHGVGLRGPPFGPGGDPVEQLS